MILKIAYRNLWRNKLRSLMVIIAIALGIWGGLLVLGLAQGLLDMRHKNAVATYVSHIQIHDAKYTLYGMLEQTIPAWKELETQYRDDERVLGISSRLKTEAFLQSANGSSALMLNGIEPADEAGLRTIHTLLKEENYFKQYKSRQPVIISQHLADRLDLGIGSSLRLSYNNSRGTTVSDVYKVIDLYKTGNSVYDALNAFVLRSDLAKSLQLEHVHEMSMVLSDESEVNELASEISQSHPDLTVQTWDQVAPELGYADQMMELIMTLFLGIIMAALAFGIINTMLMAVLERRKELGMLLAVGMNKKRVFKMIMTETLILTFLGAPFGMLLAIITQLILGSTGIDLAFLSQGLESVGLESTVYPTLSVVPLLIQTVLVVLTGFLSAVYPARKALSLNPGETLRTAV